ncbi:MAG: hypothetical protein ACRCW2_05975 [Cellulosilyticaceae bacterium]
MGISAYFSKVDWHVPSYWAPDQQEGTVNEWLIPYHEDVTAVRLLGCEETIRFEQTEAGLRVTCSVAQVANEQIATVFELTV